MDTQALISHDKMEVLVHELLVIEVSVSQAGSSMQNLLAICFDASSVGQILSNLVHAGVHAPNCPS